MSNVSVQSSQLGGRNEPFVTDRHKQDRYLNTFYIIDLVLCWITVSQDGM